MSVTLTREVLAKYPNAAFVETGAYKGDAIQLALEAGFRKVISVELNPELHRLCAIRYAADVRVNLWRGDSAMLLCSMLEDLAGERATIWLDAHWTDQTGGNFPLYMELDALRSARRHDHTILIDDVCHFGKMGYSLSQVERLLGLISPEYRLTRVDNRFVPGDILVAVAGEA